MKYVNKQNGKVMEILKQDEKKGTMLIQFEDGKSTSITTGTFKRWYKKVEDNVATEIETPVNEPDKTVVDGVTDEEYIQEVMKQKKELGIECPPITEVEVVEAGDGTSYSQVMQEIITDEKTMSKKVKKEKTPKREINPEIPTILDYIIKKLGKQAEIFTPEKAPKVRALKFNGHMFARLNLSTSCIYLCCRSKAVQEVPTKTTNHMFDAMFEIKDLSNTGLIDSLLQESLEYQKNKKTKKEEK